MNTPRFLFLLAVAALAALLFVAPTWKDAAFAGGVGFVFVGIWTAWHEPKRRDRGGPKKPRKTPRSRKAKPAPKPEPGQPLPFLEAGEGGAP